MDKSLKYLMGIVITAAFFGVVIYSLTHLLTF